MEKAQTKKQEPPKPPQFLKSIVTPLDPRVEMGKLGKMCSCFCYGS